LIVPIALSVLTALAQVGAAAATRLPGPERVTVEGLRERDAADPTGSATIIRPGDFEGRITSVPELLSEAAGVHLKAYGTLGSFATVSIRGSSAEQVNIYLDGVLLNVSSGGGVNLADLPLSHVESIEVYRGFTPSFLASSAIGGAINIVTRRGGDGGSSGEGTFMLGSLRSYDAHASWSRRSDRSDAFVNGGAAGSEGDFTFYDGNGTPYVSSDDGYTTRTNNELRMTDMLASARFRLREGLSLQAQASVTDRDQGVPGIDAFQSESADAASTRALAGATLTQGGLLDGALSIDWSLSYQRLRQQFMDQAGEITGGVPTDNAAVMDALEPRALLRWFPRSGGPSQEVIFSTVWRRETAQRRDEMNPIPDRGDALRTTWEVAAEDQIRWIDGRLLVSPSVRATWYQSDFAAPSRVPVPEAAEQRGSDLSPRLGLAWQAAPGLTLRTSAGRFHRVPSFLEIFGDQGSIRGGDDLAPEEGVNVEAGAAWSPRPRGVMHRLSLDAVIFRSDADNLIQLVRTSQSQAVAQNTGAARVAGAEASIAADLWSWLSGSVSYTWQVATDMSDTFRNGSDLPGRPRHEGTLQGTATASWGRPWYQFAYIGPNYFDSAAAAIGGGGSIPRDQVRVPGRYLHSAGFTRALGKRYEATLEVDNIFNVKTADVARFPLPGRVVQARLRIRL